jgi:ribonuclease Z
VPPWPVSVDLVAGLSLMAGSPWVSTVQAGEAVELSPTKARPRDTDYPNTEVSVSGRDAGDRLPHRHADDMRRPGRGLFPRRVGNGDKCLFDAGTGSAERISSLQIPYNCLDKIFIGHLHTDDFGALPEYTLGGVLMGRNVPLRVWGPSGSVPELGTAAALEAMEKTLLWDITGRVGMTDSRGYRLEVNGFDYKGVNQVIFDENGVVIRSFPAIHSIDGSVSFALEWNGLKFVYGSKIGNIPAMRALDRRTVRRTR